MAKRSHSTKIRSEDGFLGSRHDGTAEPVLAGAHLRNVIRASKHPDVLSRHLEVFEKLLDGRETLAEDEVRALRHAARHPDFAGPVSQSLGAAADLHEAARQEDKRAAVEADSPSNDRSLTPSEIKRDISNVLGASYPPRGNRRGRR